MKTKQPGDKAVERLITGLNDIQIQFA